MIISLFLSLHACLHVQNTCCVLFFSLMCRKHDPNPRDRYIIPTRPVRSMRPMHPSSPFTPCVPCACSHATCSPQYGEARVREEQCPRLHGAMRAWASHGRMGSYKFTGLHRHKPAPLGSPLAQHNTTGGAQRTDLQHKRGKRGGETGAILKEALWRLLAWTHVAPRMGWGSCLRGHRHDLWLTLPAVPSKRMAGQSPIGRSLSVLNMRPDRCVGFTWGGNQRRSMGAQQLAACVLR